MEDNDELKHLCKYCGKRFRSGRSLGGHVSSHREWIWESSLEVDDGVTGIYKKKLRPLSDYAMEVEEEEEEEDVEAFLASLDPNHETVPSRTVSKLLDKRAIGCLTALVERKLPHNRLDLFAFSSCNKPLISTAAWMGFHEAVGLFLRHGVPPSHGQPGRLPIDYALYSSCDDQWDLLGRYDINYPQRLCSLMLWLPEWISEYFNWWHTVKLLARTTEQGILEMRIFQYARNGQGAKLLWLLLVVPDRVLSPTFFRDTLLQQRFGTASLSLRDFLIAQLAFVTGLSFTIEPNRRFPTDIDHTIDRNRPPRPDSIRGHLRYKMLSLTCSLRLLEVFRRAGPQLCHSMEMLEKEKEKGREREKQRQMYPLLPDYPIAQQIKTVLKEAGFTMASLRCPVRVAHRNYKPEPDYRWTPQRDDYPELEFLIRPPHVCKSKILDSDFNKVIKKLCHHPYLKEWTSQMSIFKLLFIFCLPDLVEEMQSMILLESKYVNPSTIIQRAYLAELCFIYIREGRIVEFTAALMATQVLLRLGYPLRPQTSRNSFNNVDHPHQSHFPTVYELLLHALMKVVDEEISLTGKPKDNDSIQICKEKKSVISSAFLLIKIFDTSAQDIHWYLHSPRYKKVRDLELIVNDVASLLKGVGFVLRSQDTCVKDLRCFSSKSSIDETKLEGRSSSFEPLSHTTKSVTISRRTIERSTFVASPIGKLSARFYHSFSISRFEGSKPSSLPLTNKVNFVVKKLKGTKQLENASGKSWRFLRVIKRVMTWF
ncbi:unnamed protein product [Linum tenue]|uniref:C2H2-type domain-containing protein n=1 Tax=Linum tenue TaxID=586396 RepID=A0AAV0NF10_9ROSI|nr:unnamed protein product [Linum tenue]